jgi:nucleotide-binding universal stress UspA family protein
MRPVLMGGGDNVHVVDSALAVSSRDTSANFERIAHFRPAKVRTIMVPLDGSAFGERALPLAVEIAERTGSELRIAHVDTAFGHPFTRERLVQDKIDCDYCTKLELNKRAYLERITAQIRSESSVRVTPILLNSRNVVAALCEAISGDVDLVVMAAYGKGLVRRWVRGSTAHELIREAEVPVLIVGADGSFATQVPDRVRRILVALDGSRNAEQAIGPALALGDVNSAEYVLLRVVPLSTFHGPLSSRYGSSAMNDGFGRIQLATARRYLDRVVSRMKDQSCIVDTRVVVDQRSIARSIAAHAAAYDADLIAIATRKDAKKRWQGSIAKRVVQFASVPVLVAAA